MSRAPHDNAQTHNLCQRQYFERTSKKTMVPVDSPYLCRHIDQALCFVELTSQDRVFEVGCGMGRYTLLLAARGVNVKCSGCDQ